MKRLLPVVLLLAGCSGSRPGASAANSPDTPAKAEGARSIPVVALRLPAAGGQLRAYLLPSLAPAGWGIGGRVSPTRAVVGMDAAGRRLLYRDSAGAIQSFDLVAYREKVVAPRGTLAAMASDGTLLAVSSDGTVIESEPWGARPWPSQVGRGVRDAFAGLGSRLIALRHAGGDSMALATREAGISLTAPVPDATARSASRDGDAVALATDSGLVVVEDRDPRDPWFVRLQGSPVEAAFSPSGHRIYVALKTKSELAVVDRFQRRERPAIPLPGPAGALRLDPWGRAILVLPGARERSGDTWVVALATGRVAGSVSTRWASDLPTVSEGGLLLVRAARAVVARDIHSLDSLGAVADGAADLWFVGRWKPATGAAAVRQEARAPDSVPSRPAPGVDETPPPVSRAAAGAAPAPARPPVTSAVPAVRGAIAPGAPPTAARVWVQVSVSQNEGWARDLAAELARSGRPAQVIEPKAAGDGWRVVIGPYQTHAAADSAGRMIGRPYWILERGAESGARP